MNPFIELIGYSIQSKSKCFGLDLGKMDECGFRRGLLVDQSRRRDNLDITITNKPPMVSEGYVCRPW